MNNRKLRITFRNGDFRMCDMPPGRSLPELWTYFKRDGAIVGDGWCCQFDFVALIEVVEISAAQHRPEEDRPESAESQIARLSNHIAAGGWRPPEA
jgi:hypothetical protein